MEDLKVVKVENDLYTLKNINNNIVYEFRMKFYGIDKTLKTGDLIALHKELLDKNYVEYSSKYEFGPLDEVYGRKVKGIEDIDVVELTIDNKKIYLKRFFG